MESLVLAAVLSALFALAWLNRKQLESMVFCATDSDMKIVSTGDDDMKIAPGSFSSVLDEGEEAAERAAQEFLAQKELGNIDKARQLGREYAEAVLDGEQGMFVYVEDEPAHTGILHQQILLYSYAVNRVISEKIPNSILAQTTLNVFFNQLEEVSPRLFKQASDMAAFSLYILCERSIMRSDNQIGTIYAELCGFRGNPQYVQEGNDLFAKYYDYAADKFGTVEFA